jgi:DNA-binding response OmpR family regulator
MNNKNILLVEDDLNLGTILKEYLEVKSYIVTHCKNGIEGKEAYLKGKYDLCIFDIMMPKKDGFTLAKEIRENDKHTPIIFLTAKSMQADKIEGFKLGGDDYITKPFSTEELLLRINVILKRVQNGNPDENQEEFTIGRYYYNSNKRELKFNAKTQKLTSKENDLLKQLVLNKNKILERSLALTKVWNDDNYFNSRSMDVYITKLRGYLKEDPSVEIANIHGEGFKLIAE